MRRKGYIIHHGFWDGGAKEDTPPWLAVKLLTKIQQFREAVSARKWRTACLRSYLIGILKERLFWKQGHEEAAVSHYAAREKLAYSQKMGAKEVREIAEELNRRLLAYLQAKQPNAYLSARDLAKLAKKDLGDERSVGTLQRIIREFNNAGLISLKRNNTKNGKG